MLFELISGYVLRRESYLAPPLEEPALA
jgi:hypothetical protein